ncbi:MAG: Lrp/AsnC family transcriptional regulator [Desulfacinum sp.]|jgi:Lrp/AsnC family transcriptional regulator for asnA, asnC and gidA|nr:Lrp/AsnC family transcriptional regulator [Desulfacinum sp.]
MKRSVDAIDEKIIDLLHENGRMSNTEIAKRINVSEATVRNRLNRLIQEDILRILPVVNPAKMGLSITGNLKATIDLKKLDYVVEELKKLDEIWYIALTTGGTDLDVEFVVPSLDHLHTFLFDKVNKIDGVVRTQTAFVMKRYIKRRYDYTDESKEWDVVGG